MKENLIKQIDLQFIFMDKYKSQNNICLNQNN